MMEPSESAAYEPPRVERVITPEDLAREIQYAGLDGSPGEDQEVVPP